MNFTIFNISNKKYTYIQELIIYIIDENDDCDLLAIVQLRISIKRKYGVT